MTNIIITIFLIVILIILVAKVANDEKQAQYKRKQKAMHDKLLDEFINSLRDDE